MVDARVAGVPRTVVRKGIGLETPNYGSCCKGSVLLLVCKISWAKTGTLTGLNKVSCLALRLQ